MTIFEKVGIFTGHPPPGVAVVAGSRALTYAALSEAVGAAAANLLAAGLQPGDRLAVSLKDSPEFLVWLLGAARLGVAVLPLDWRAPPAERGRLLEAVEVGTVLVEPGSAPIEGCRCLPAGMPGAGAAAGRHTQLPPPREADPFLLVPSSGTTGAPRASVLTHGDFDARFARQRLVHGPLAGHRYLSVNPLCFSGGLMYCLYHLASGNPVVLYPPLFTAAEFVGLVQRHQVSYVFVVPTVLRWLLDLPAQPEPLLPGLRVLLTSAAPLTADEKLAVRERVSPRLFEYYACSSAGAVSVLCPEDFADHADSVGRPLASLELGIADAAGRALPAGQQGRVRCRGPGVSGRLLGGGPDGAEEVQADGWCCTGDLGWLDASGYLHLAGRADQVIIRGGVNVHPEVIERVLREHPAVAEALVGGRPSPTLGEEVVARVETRRPVTLTDLDAHCRSRLPGHMVPAQIEIVASLPRTAAGKIRRMMD